MIDDNHDAAALHNARETLLGAGAQNLPRPPWSHPNLPPDDVTLLRFAHWRASAASLEPTEIGAALRLIDSARAELEGLESALLFIARADGLTWAEIAEPLGVRSPQAAQQRFHRVSSRSDGR